MNEKPSVKRKWRQEGLKKAQCGCDGALGPGSRRGGRDTPPSAADRMQEGRLWEYGEGPGVICCVLMSSTNPVRAEVQEAAKPLL